MSLFDAILLGIIQGVTEFLPISSSGHLVIIQKFLGVVSSGGEFEILVHIGTLGSILVVFFLLNSFDLKLNSILEIAVNTFVILFLSRQ